jgi:hypothetical protein
VEEGVVGVEVEALVVIVVPEVVMVLFAIPAVIVTVLTEELAVAVPEVEPAGIPLEVQKVCVMPIEIPLEEQKLVKSVPKSILALKDN